MSIHVPDGVGCDDTAGLAVTFRTIGPVCLLSLRGALCAGSLRALEAEVDRLSRTTCEHVVVDVADVVRTDDAGARLLSGLGHYVAARGGRLTVIGAGPSLDGLDGLEGVGDEDPPLAR